MTAFPVDASTGASTRDGLLPDRSATAGTLTILATTDVHGNALDFDYVTDGPWRNDVGVAYGLARAASSIERVRQERGEESVVVLDNGDTLQGNLLTHHYARVSPIQTTGETHPLAAAFNAIGYDAHNLGNHEFNHELAHVDAFTGQLAAPLLGGNVLDEATGQPRWSPSTIVERTVSGEPVLVGILGLTTPGAMVWDRTRLGGRVRITDMVDAARTLVPQLRKAGADVVVVLAHAGIGPTSYALGAVPGGVGEENPGLALAQVPGIDVLVLGHTHQDIPELLVDRDDGSRVVVTQPRYWAASVSQVTLRLAQRIGRWEVLDGRATTLPSAGQPEHPDVVDAVQEAHEMVRTLASQPVARIDACLSAVTSHWRDEAIVGLVQQVQIEAIRDVVAGTEWEHLPVVSLTSPFSRNATLGPGEVTLRNLFGLYPYDNILQAVVLTGAQVRAHLEHAARYWGDVSPGEEFDPTTMTGVERDGEPVWDHQLDLLAGLRYEIELTAPLGSRLRGPWHTDGRALTDDEQLVVAVNDYRRAGGGGYPDIAAAPLLVDTGTEVRELVAAWARKRRVLDVAEFPAPGWRLLVDGAAIIA